MKRSIVSGEELYQRKQAVIEGIIEGKRGWLRAGKELMIIKQKRLYRLEGHHATSFAYWVENELGISKASAYQMIDIYNRLGELLLCKDYIDVDYSKAALLLPLLTDKTTLQEKEDLLSMAKTQSVRGLKDNIRNKSGKTATDECLHPDGRQEPWNKCLNCGKMWR